MLVKLIPENCDLEMGLQLNFRRGQHKKWE